MRDKSWVCEDFGEMILGSRVRMWGRETELEGKLLKNASMMGTPANLWI
jgi:hypothetical protein